MYTKYAKLRDAHGLTDYQVAKDTAIPKSALYEWGYGRSVPKLDKIAKLAKYFNVPIEYFIDDK